MFPKRFFQQFRRYVAQQLPPAAPVGEPIMSTDTGVVYVGQGMDQPLKPVGGVVKQVTKLNVTGSVDTPYVVDVEVEVPATFALNAPTILYLDGNTQDVVMTQCDFNNADASSFQPNSVVAFDGQMKLKTSIDLPFVDQGAVGAGKMFSVAVDPTQFKSITQIEVI